MKVSVVMATYNGEKFVKEQIESILPQLNKTDEIIVSDNGSTDDTVEIIKSFNSEKIKLFHCEERGIVNNFNNALKNATGDLLFFCDQDDVWNSDRVEKFKAVYDDEQPLLIVGDGECVDENLIPNGEDRILKRGYLRNLLKNSYVGAFMAINRKLLEVVGLVPKEFVLHDIYYSLVSEKAKFKIVHLKEKLMMYRRHEGTQTGISPYGFIEKLKLRRDIDKSIKNTVKEIKGKKNNG